MSGLFRQKDLNAGEKNAQNFSDYFPCWKDLTPDQQKFLLSAVHVYHYPKGTLLHSGSSDCIGLLLVTSGQVRVYTVSDEGRELTLYRLFARDVCLFSASCIMPSIQFDVMVSAEQDSTAFVIPAKIYQTLMERSAAVANYTNELMASRFSDVMWLMDQILNKKLDTRLAAFLLEESELSGNNAVMFYTPVSIYAECFASYFIYVWCENKFLLK